MANQQEESLGGDGNVLKLDCGDGCTKNCTVKMGKFMVCKSYSIKLF